MNRLMNGWRTRVTGRTNARPPFRNNARLVLATTLVALAALVGVEVLLRKRRADFGLGGFAGPVEVEVRLPGGRRWSWKGLAADRLHVLRLGEEP